MLPSLARVWEISSALLQPGVHGRGGFPIWPEGMGDPTDEHLTTAADLPAGELVEIGASSAIKEIP